jgi:very-short-patch-repair endonuclease
MESEMPDEKPLHELKWNDVFGTDLYPTWKALHHEAFRVLQVAEHVMHRWQLVSGSPGADPEHVRSVMETLFTEEERRGATPFEGKFAAKQLDRVWPFLVLKVDETLAEMCERGCSQEEVDEKSAEYNLMLKLMVQGERPGDAEPPTDPYLKLARSRAAIAEDRSESHIEKALLAALRKSGRLCVDPKQIAADCEGAPERCGIFIYQQATVLHYRADFLLGAMAAPDATPHWVVVECDGHQFHERTAEQAEHDRARDRAMTAAGYRVFRFTGREIQRDARRCANEVIAYLQPFTRGLS